MGEEVGSYTGDSDCRSIIREGQIANIIIGRPIAKDIDRVSINLD